MQNRLGPRLWLPLAGIFLVFGLIILRLGQLQLALHSSLKEKTRREVVHSVTDRPLRGRILDVRGRPMAVSVSRPSVAVAMRDVKVSKPELAIVLAKNLSGVSSEQLLKRFQSGAKFIWIKRMATLEEGERLKKLDISGVEITPEDKRLYPQTELAAELLGGVSIDGGGSGGLEYGLNSLLEGREVLRIILRDALGKVFAERIEDRLREGASGSRKAIGPFDVYLTIDAELQSHLEKRLLEAINTHAPRMAMAVVQDVATGAILAMGSKTVIGIEGRAAGFDPNAVASFTFEPGSVVKPLVLASAFEAGTVSEETEINCEHGSYYLSADHKITDHEPYDTLNVADILAYSSNIGMAKIGMELGAQSIFMTLRSLGFGAKSTLPITGEAAGILRPTETWGPVTAGMMSFGYEIGATGLQLVNAYSALANQGVLLDPQLVSVIKKPRESEVLYNLKPRRIREAVSKKTARRVLALMDGVVRYGTGGKAKIPGYPIAGKTGTAQKIDPKTGKHSPTSVMVTFCGVLPMPKPQIAICAILDDPTKPRRAFAGDVAAPLFTGVAQDAINILSILPTETASAKR